MSLDQERMRLPSPTPTPRRAGVPVIAIVAPVVMAGALWVMTSSPYALMLAFFGPVVALAGWLEARRSQRRDRRAAIDDTRRRLVELEAQVALRIEAKRLALSRRASPHPSVVEGESPSPILLRVGTGPLASGIVMEGDEPHPELVDVVRRVRQSSATIPDAPILVVEEQAHFVVDAPAVVVRALARSLALQVLASCPVAGVSVRVPAGERWAGALPHATDEGEWEIRIGDRRLLRVVGGCDAPSDATVIRAPEGLASLTSVGEHRSIDAMRLSLMCAADAAAQAARLAERARAAGWRPDSAIPQTVEFASLPPIPSERAGPLAVVVGIDAEGPVVVDLDAEGPHALVAGTTGSGKSELLVTWMLALARDHSPGELGFLLIDFKGGASFAPVRSLPHVVGMVSDLEPATAARAIASLRAELRRREEHLAVHGARSIDELAPGGLSRLVILVDEFAALVAVDPGLQLVFADLAARGRSLGLHLILCTQRPSGVVREAVLANVTLRICLRVIDVADSRAVIGQADAARLRPEQRGRGLLSGPGGGSGVQFAITRPADIEAVRARWASHPPTGARPWLDPLPGRLPASALGELASAPTDGLVIGAVDLPERQRQEQLAVDPWGGGALLVVGATGSGRSAALHMLADAARAAGVTVRAVPDDPAELWQALTQPSAERRVLVVADDLDRMLAWVDADVRAELGELIARAIRDTRRTGIALVASSRTGGGAMHAVQSAFEQRLILRLASREEHLLAGGELAAYRPDRRPGSGLWGDTEVQIALASSGDVDGWRAPLAEITPSPEWAIVAPRARELAEAFGGDTVVRDVDGWLADHAGLSAARRSGRLLLIGCSPSDHRTLTRSRSPLPPLTGDDDAWHYDGETTTRVRVRRPVGSGEAER